MSVSTCICAWLFYITWRCKNCFFTPHYLPIRFNRKTQKIYVSDLIIEGNIFFGKIKLTFHEYDWKDVEGWEVSRHFSKSMPYNGLHLVVNRENDINALRQTRVYTTRAPWSAQEMARQKNYIPKYGFIAIIIWLIKLCLVQRTNHNHLFFKKQLAI
ncbi:DUF6708 domain-containing protein [Escherichia coli]